MKVRYKLCGALLLSAIGAGLIFPSATQANEIDGKGKVNFTEDLTINPPNTLPGEEDGPILTEPDQDLSPAAMKIVSVTDMDFDTHTILANDTNKTYDVLPFATTDTGGNAIKTAHFIRYQDVRSNVVNNFHTVTAKMTQQFTNATLNTTLDAATISYKKISLVTGSNSSTLPAQPLSTQTLELNDPVNFVQNQEAGKGFGVFEIMFGTNADAQGDNYEDTIVLNVPGSNVLKSGDYTAVVKWTIADAI